MMKKLVNPLRAVAYVDGSFNSVTRVYGYGGCLIVNGKRHIIQGHGSDPNIASMRNVAGELLGSIEAIRMALKLEVDHLTIYYDYLGIEKWVTGEWKCNKPFTQEYADWVNEMKTFIKINFIKVKAHSGDRGNTTADFLARDAVGLT